jgi:hypothetical protein
MQVSFGNTNKETEMKELAAALTVGTKFYWNTEVVEVTREARDVNDKLVAKNAKGLRITVPGSELVTLA